MGAMSRPSYPMLLDVSTRLCVIIGGGGVAARKASGLLDAGATRVRVIAPEYRAEFGNHIERVVGRFEAVQLDGAGIVFAATDDPQVNAAVVHEARARGIPVCRADQDDDDPGDFATLAKLRLGEVILGVSAVSPALAVHIRDEIQRLWRPGWSMMAEVMQELRFKLIAANVPITVRKQIFRELASSEAIDLLETRGREALDDWIGAKHPEVNHA